ncbi:DNA polymerase III [Labilibaculum sp. A4]|uniref:exonuclease domain-containing protein n=1 Tax=Labilibaculum euxinus TaxID=2686357 RepID=UPI000F6169C5|nr:exonuclease domain-containing protein [Labilibaculum euxinus]MDQ1770542.1 exonuclease domain-containing protein [Labilibaculum euxinus]MWN75239.1 DNA polymerase III [Labilibaculum euxinus]
MDFITIDFETATSQRNSPCEIGLTFVKNFEIVESKSWLIKPINNEFDYFNISIHGINPEDVAKKPEFDEVWHEIKPLIENQFLIAHNASFDFSVLRKTLETYNIPFPELEYSCSYIFSKKVWLGLPGYDLKTLCNHNNIKFKHHRAESDSRATAELTIKALKKAGVQSKEDFPDKLRTNIGKLFSGGYKPSDTKKSSKTIDLKKIIGDPQKHNKESIFYGRTIVFTGTLSSMIRKDAQQLIADIGGINGNSITKSTDYLIVGQQDYRVVGEDGMSNKQEKAIKYIEQGSDIEILSENEFTRNI